MTIARRSCNSSCPGLTRASTSLPTQARKTWMAGTSPAKTKTRRRRTRPRSHPEISVLQIRLGDQLGRRAAPHRPSAFDDVVTVGDAGEVFDVLVDHQNRLAARLQH